jgi:hypothetical protein
MTSQEYLDFMKKELGSIQELVSKKNADYTNQGSAFANFDKSIEWGVDPLIGLLVRVEDKMQRLKSFASMGKLQVEGEGPEDALRDVIGYSCIALAMLSEGRKEFMGSVTVIPDSLANAELGLVGLWMYDSEYEKCIADGYTPQDIVDMLKEQEK